MWWANAKRPRRRTDGAVNDVIDRQRFCLIDERRRRTRAAAQDLPDVDEIVADHAEAHPPLHAAIPFVPAAVESVPPLHHADAAFDLWNHVYRASASSGAATYEILSFGRDGKADGEGEDADISSKSSGSGR